MNVYDWDNTIYRGDSTVDFVRYCWRKRPKCLLNLPRTLVFGLLYVLHLVPKLTFKQNLYRMFRYIDDMESLTEEFTGTHMDHVKRFYRAGQKPDDVVISASPEFLISSFCARTRIRTCMASRVDIRTGVYDGLNCHGEEKVRRFREAFPDGVIDSFYSDSYSDDPLAKLASEAWLVKGDELKPWRSV